MQKNAEKGRGRMNKLKNHLIAAAVLSVLAVIGTIMNSHQAAAQGPPNGLAVNIVNPVPLPVSGTVTGNVGVTGTVAATQSGTWNVSVNGTPGILIANPATNPVFIRNVDEPGRQPYSEDVVSFCNGSNCVSSFSPVPQGKRLVIEHVGGLARPTSAAIVFSFAELLSSNPNNLQVAVGNQFPMTLIGKADYIPYNSWGFNQPVKAYVEAGSYPRITMQQQNQGAVLFAQATISGYFVSVNP
jgi:hypothetical protein